MKEIKQALAILKARWPEAALLIAIWFLPKILMQMLKEGSFFAFLPLLLSMGIYLIIAIILTGFLRTIFLQEHQKQSIFNLIKVGKYFFWRYFGFFLLLTLVMVPFFMFILPIKLHETHPFVHRIYFILVTLIFAKPLLLTPAIIVTADCKVFESLKLTWKVKFLQAKPLLILFFIQIGILPSLLLFYPDANWAKPTTLQDYTVIISYYVMSNFVGLVVHIMAVKFVASFAIVSPQPYQPPQSFKYSGIA